jgi:uncharacterized protein YdeI (BOF family)
MKLKWIVPILTGLLCLNGIAETNFIQNGDFESWNGSLPDYWQLETSGLSLTRDTTDYYNGQSAAKIVLTSKDTQILLQDSIPVVGGNKYRLAMYVKENDDAGRLRFWGYWLGHDVDGGPQAPSYSSDNEEWQLYEMEIEVPNGARFMNLEIRFYDVSSKWDGDAEFRIDNLLLEPLAPLKPDIFNVTDSVFYEGSTIEVQAHICDDQTIDEAWLFYSVNGVLPFTQTDMTWQEADCWQGGIPACQQGDRLEFYIMAEDDETNVNSARTDTFRILIGKNDIATARQQDENGVPLLQGFKARMEGIVTVESGIFSEKYHDSYIQDNTGGINIYSEEKRETDLTAGDRIEVVGKLDQIGGRSVVVPEKIAVIETGVPFPEIPVLTCMQAGESYEGQIIEIRDVSVEDWISKADTSFIATLSDGSGSLKLLVHEQTDIDGHSDPAGGGTTIIRGILSQYDEEMPYTDEYCVLPRSWSDFTVTALEDPIYFVTSMALFQNHPNPFNPETNIHYQLNKKSDVKIRIYDILGREVDILTPGQQSAGMYAIKWDGSKFASGVYFCLFEAGNYRQIRKMVLMQ